MEELNPRKRPRPVVSCMRCRDRKLKCDRATPCENCVKARNGNACTYYHSAGSAPKDDSPMQTTPVISLLDLQSRLNRVEELLGISREVPKSIEPTSSQTIGTVVVKGDSSFYRGQNDRAALLNQFLEVKEHINAISKDSQIQATAKQIKFLQNKTRGKITSPDSHIESETCLALMKLREFLPPKAYCDRLVKIYFQHFERTMRVLHIPTFMYEYDQIWSDGNSAARILSSAVPKLTAVMTMACHMDDVEQSNDSQIHRSYLKGAATNLIQAWLDELTRKQRTEVSTLQVEVLLLLSKSLRYLHPEKLWSSTGALVRSAMTMGFHMNPELIPALTPYVAEMRRRLWTTVLEIDLQASMVCGMPLVVPEVDPASLTSANLNDADFGEPSLMMPSSHPMETCTDNIYQAILSSSLPQRIRAVSLVQRGAPDFHRALILGKELQEFIALKPRLMDLNSDNGTYDGGFLLHRLLLDLYMRRPILCLYKPLLADYQQAPSALAEIQKYCLDSSRVILSYQDYYTLSALSAVTESPWAHQNFFYRCCKTDILWAALTLCEQAKRNSRDNQAAAELDTTHLVERVENTIACLIDRISQKSSDLKDIVFLAVVLRSVQLSDSAPERPQALREAARQTMAACRETLLQPLVTKENLYPTNMEDANPSTSITPTVNRNTIQVQASDPRLSPALEYDTSLPFDTSQNSQQWFADFPDLAAEYIDFHPTMFDSNDPLNFGIKNGWDWERMWQ